MKTFKIIALLVFFSVIGIIVYSTAFRKNRHYYATVSPEERDIIERIYIPGNIYPIKEIEIKSQLSGILDKVLVSIGDEVNIGTPIATVSLVANSSDIESLENNVNLTRIEYEAQSRIYQRDLQLYNAKAIPKSDLENTEKAYLTSQERFISAQNQLSLLKEGIIRSKDISNIVKSSTKGTIIDIPQEEGASIIERNNFNPGTTLAVVAEMNRFKFRAQIAEQFLKSIHIGAPIQLSFSAYEDLIVTAFISKISAKGVEENGIVKYLLDAEFDVPDSIPFLRSSYSATADIIINSKPDVLSLEEKYINFRNDSVYVNVLDTTRNLTVKQLIQIGVSDGTYTEIRSGITRSDKIITESFEY